MTAFQSLLRATVMPIATWCEIISQAGCLRITCLCYAYVIVYGCLLCIQMSTLCEQLVTLASNGLSQSTDISPEAATSAVTTLVEENTHLKEDIERVTQQLQQV